MIKSCVKSVVLVLSSMIKEKTQSEEFLIFLEFYLTVKNSLRLMHKRYESDENMIIKPKKYDEIN